MALLKKSEAATLALKSYRAECWQTKTDDRPQPPEHDMATLTAEKPNLMRYDDWNMMVDAQGKWSKKSPTTAYTFVCDGKTQWTQMGDGYHFDKYTDPHKLLTMSDAWEGFYDADDSPYALIERNRKHGYLVELRLDGTETIDGVVCTKVFAKCLLKGLDGMANSRTTWYIGPDGLVRRKVIHVNAINKPGYATDSVVRHLQTNLKIDRPDAVFASTPQEDVQREYSLKDAPRVIVIEPTHHK